MWGQAEPEKATEALWFPSSTAPMVLLTMVYWFPTESKLWSDEAYFELGQNKAFKLETENAFGDWIVLKFSYGAPFLWNLKTLRKQSINIFELYVIIEEFQINKYNSLNIKDGEDVVIKEGKKYIDGHFVEDLKPLKKINYNSEE